MATFPAPDLELRTFQRVPVPGTLLTEADLLQIIYELLRPLNAITYAMINALPMLGVTDEGDALVILLEFIEEIQEQAVLLLEAWKTQQSPPPTHWPMRSAPSERPDDPDAEADVPPVGRRRRARNMDA